MTSGTDRYTLLYGDLELGEVTQTGADFPNFCVGGQIVWRYNARRGD